MEVTVPPLANWRRWANMSAEQREEEPQEKRSAHRGRLSLAFLLGPPATACQDRSLQMGDTNPMSRVFHIWQKSAEKTARGDVHVSTCVRKSTPNCPQKGHEPCLLGGESQLACGGCCASWWWWVSPPFKITRGPAPMLVALGAGNKRLDLLWKDPGLLP